MFQWESMPYPNNKKINKSLITKAYNMSAVAQQTLQGKYNQRKTYTE